MRRHDPFLWPLLVGRDAPWILVDAASDPASRQAARLDLPANGRLILVQPSGGLRHAARSIADAGFVEERRAVLRFDDSSGVVSSALVAERQPPVLERLAAACRARLHRDGLALVYRRGETASSASALSDLLRPYETRIGSAAVTVHRGSGGTFRAMTESAVARLPSVRAAVPRFEANHRALERLARDASPFAVPSLLAVGTHGQLPYSIETRLAGRPLDYLRASAATLERAAASAVAALAAFQRATVRREIFGGGHVSRLLEWPAERLGRSLDARARTALESYVQRLRPLARERIVPLVFTHGDFKVGNLLWSGQDQVCGVVDWDLSSPAGFPIVDYAFYLAFDRSVTRRLPFAQCVAALVGDAAGPSGDGVYQRHCRSLGIDDMLFDAGVIMALVHFGNNHPGLLDDAERRAWNDRHLSRHLTAACDAARVRLDSAPCITLASAH